MRFTLTIAMATKNAPVHQVFVEHPAESLDAFVKLLSTHDFIIAEEFYLYKEGSASSVQWKGPIALNHMVVGKVKEYEER